jgi:hypothetical protein
MNEPKAESPETKAELPETEAELPETKKTKFARFKQILINIYPNLPNLPKLPTLSLFKRKINNLNENETDKLIEEFKKNIKNEYKLISDTQINFLIENYLFQKNKKTMFDSFKTSDDYKKICYSYLETQGLNKTKNKDLIILTEVDLWIIVVKFFLEYDKINNVFKEIEKDITKDITDGKNTNENNLCIINKIMEKIKNDNGFKYICDYILNNNENPRPKGDDDETTKYNKIILLNNFLILYNKIVSPAVNTSNYIDYVIREDVITLIIKNDGYDKFQEEYLLGKDIGYMEKKYGEIKEIKEIKEIIENLNSSTAYLALKTVTDSISIYATISLVASMASSFTGFGGGSSKNYSKKKRYMSRHKKNMRRKTHRKRN